MKASPSSAWRTCGLVAFVGHCLLGKAEERALLQRAIEKNYIKLIKEKTP